ncbi:hypothetical protein OS493_007189 [Desmophyllum pertusum]|uniref:Uncharacterized protein n=1 Tax=Desmophyllum pertusum TaxID=174260 RepID=A0A9W9ZFP3_9CNID|nr:hypothetical protein OS493_007189 [Desmophyllum pertusum]
MAQEMWSSDWVVIFADELPLRHAHANEERTSFPLQQRSMTKSPIEEESKTPRQPEPNSVFTATCILVTVRHLDFWLLLIKLTNTFRAFFKTARTKELKKCSSA